MADKTNPETTYHDFNPLNHGCFNGPDPTYDGDTIGPAPDGAAPPDGEPYHEDDPHVDPRRPDGEDPMDGEPGTYDPRDPNGVDGADGDGAP